MKRLLRRIRTCLFSLAVVLAVAVFASGYAFVSRGGDPADLPRTVDDWRREGADRIETGRETLRTWGAWAMEIIGGLPDAIPQWPSGEGEPSAPPAAPPAEVLPGDTAVAVYFAPHRDRAAESAHEALLRLIGAAESTIQCAFYNFDHLPVAEALIARHRAGVRVAVVSDTDYADEAGARACIAAGIPVVFDERGAFMHHKFCVADGRYVWTGSTNITENGFFRNNNNALLIASSEIARNFAHEFDEMFAERRFGGASRSGVPYPEITVGGTRIATIFTPDDGARSAIERTIRAARTSVDFAAFAFTSAEIAEAMADRARSAVPVRGVFEARNAESSHSKDEFLLRNGVAVYNDTNPGAMHHKFIVVDRRTVVTGSYNFSNAAEDKNDENVLIIEDEDVARLFTAEVDRLISEWARPRSVGW